MKKKFVLKFNIESCFKTFFFEITVKDRFNPITLALVLILKCSTISKS